jgi:hypothetical protein
MATGDRNLQIIFKFVPIYEAHGKGTIKSMTYHVKEMGRNQPAFFLGAAEALSSLAGAQGTATVVR